MSKRITRQAYLDAVAQKIDASKTYLQYGPLDPESSQPLRDEKGLITTFSNIMDVATNHYDFTQGFAMRDDCVAQNVANFSGGDDGETYADVSLVQTMGAIDVTILTQAQSLIPFLAVDRAMSDPVDTIFYANILAINTAGGVNANDEVMPNFAPPNPNVNLGPATNSLTVTASTTTASVNFSEYLTPGTVQVSVVRSGTTYVGQDYAKNQTIYFPGTVALSATVNYNTGLVSLAETANGDVITVTALQDVGADTSGSNILKVRAEHIAIQLTAVPKQFIFEENEPANMYMNRIAAKAAKAGAITDYRDLHFQRLTNMYIENVNRDLIRILVTLGAAVTPVNLNLAAYSVGGSFAMTKDDLVAKFFIDLRTDFLSRTNTPGTVVVTGTQGGALLESHQTKWVPAPNYYSQMNGFIGTFNGVPVYRHNLLDVLATAGQADFYVGAKLPDNSSGTMVFGEFLPLVQTSTIGNYTNPMQKSTGWFSQVGSIPIQAGLVSHGVVKLGQY